MTPLFAITAPVNLLTHGWASVVVMNADGVAVGCDVVKTADIFKHPAKLVDGRATVTMGVMGIYPTKGDALRANADAVARFNPQGQGQFIKCVDTGEIFSTAADVVTAHGVDAGALSRHLSGRAGHKTVKGRRYIRSDAPVAAAK